MTRLTDRDWIYTYDDDEDDIFRQKLQYYENLEDDGRLFVSTVSIGDKVWLVEDAVYQVEIMSIQIYSTGLYYVFYCNDSRSDNFNSNYLYESDLNKSWFLTEEAATCCFREKLETKLNELK